MKRKTFFSVLGALLILQSAAAQKAVLDTVYLQLNLDSVGLDEVVVKGRRTPVANSRWSDMTPVDSVTVGGANGDLYKALQILPGTQVQGETGELLVRGGSSYETQTYIDGMHVLNPYTSNGINTPRAAVTPRLCSAVSIWLPEAPRWSMEKRFRQCCLWKRKITARSIKLGVNASPLSVWGRRHGDFRDGILVCCVAQLSEPEVCTTRFIAEGGISRSVIACLPELPSFVTIPEE